MTQESRDPRRKLRSMGVSASVVGAIDHLTTDEMDWVVAACLQVRLHAQAERIIRNWVPPELAGKMEANCLSCRYCENLFCYVDGQGRILPEEDTCARWEANTCNT